MSEVVIAAIALTCDENELKRALSLCADLESSRLTLITRDHLREQPARGRVHFVPLRSSLVGSNGSDEPAPAATLALSACLVDAGSDQLKDLGIPGDAAHDYNIAINEGRGVVTYVANIANAASIERQFGACGFIKICRFPLTKA